MKSACPVPGSRHGLTLFEVLLSLGLFLGAVTVLSQLWWTGVRASVQSQLRTQAILRCESKMNEVVAGVVPLLQVSDTPFDDDANWTWNLQILPGPHADVVLVVVSVVHPGQGGLSAAGHQLSRLIRDPQVWTDAKAAAETAAQGATP
jgi:general secretion pathway protein I